MKDTRLLDKFNEAKQILCRYDYYIHIPKKILHLTNGELKIPHLMGLQIVREEKDTKRAEVIYQSMDAEHREQAGIEKMLTAAGIQADEKLIKAVLRLNKKFGVYHTLDMLNDRKKLFEKCMDKRAKRLVMDFLASWEGKEDGI